MKVAVVMGVFNRAAVLRSVLDAIAAQTRLPDHVVLVNDGSTDDSGAIAEAWQADVADRIRVDVLTIPNGGCGAARNRGLEHLDDPDFIHFLDSDDVIPPDFYERALAAFAEAPDAVGATADQEYVDASGARIRSRSLAGVADGATRWFVENDCGVFSATLLRASLVAEFGPLKEGLPTGDDTWFLIPASRGRTWLHLAGAPVRYGVLGDNMTTRSAETTRNWARVAEGTLPLSGLPRRDCDRILRKRWMRAGRAFDRASRHADAHACYAAALRHGPLHPEGWIRLLASWIRAKVRRN